MTPEENADKVRQNIISWIVSLALSVILCASFFLDVKSQLLDAKRSHLNDEIKMGILEQRINKLNNDILDMHRAAPATATPQHPVTDITPQGMLDTPGVSTTTTNGVNVIRGQLPASATINAQPPVGSPVPEATLPDVGAPAITPPNVTTSPAATPAETPNIQPPKMAPPSSAPVFEPAPTLPAPVPAPKQ